MKYYYAQHHIDDNDVKHVKKALSQKILSQGKYKLLLEKKVKKMFKSKYVAAVSNGSSALHLAYLSLGLGKKDYIITTPLTWTATVSAAIHCGANVKLIDIDPETLNIDTDKLENFLLKSKKKPKIIVPVHYGGSPANMKKIYEISKRYGIYVVEDAAQAMGATFKKKLIGNCLYSDITVFSMHPAKTITSGEGGLLLTNDKKIIEKVNSLKHHGIDSNKKNFRWASNIKELGFNYKISEINCALAYSQIDKIKKFVKYKEMIRNIYIKELQNFPGIEFQKVLDFCKSSNHLFTILLPKKINENKKNKIYDFLKKKNIFLTLKYLPIHQNSAYKKKFGHFKNSEFFFKRAFNLPISFKLKNKDVLYICKNIKKAILNK
jgi:dTDP-4-amino-4,6-dideoxygalactose transaminase